MQGMATTDGIELDLALIVEDDAATQRRLARLLGGLGGGVHAIGTAGSSYRAHTTQACIDGNLPFALGNTVLAPFANLAVEQLGTPVVRENGAPAVLDVAAQDSTLGWQHAWGDVLPVDTMRFASGGDSFDIAGTPVLRNAGVANLGISFTIAPDVSVDGSWQGQFCKQARDQSGRISLDWKF